MTRSWRSKRNLTWNITLLTWRSKKKLIWNIILNLYTCSKRINNLIMFHSEAKLYLRSFNIFLRFKSLLRFLNKCGRNPCFPWHVLIVCLVLVEWIHILRLFFSTKIALILMLLKVSSLLKNHIWGMKDYP